MVVLTDDELRSWQEVQHHLSELTKQPGWGALLEFSHERMKGMKKSLLNGGEKSYEEYLKHTGYLRGIHDTLDAPKAVTAIVEDELNRRRELLAG